MTFSMPDSLYFLTDFVHGHGRQPELLCQLQAFIQILSDQFTIDDFHQFAEGQAFFFYAEFIELNVRYGYVERFHVDRFLQFT